MNILFTAKQRGSTSALAPVVEELSFRGHNISVYTTGNSNEASGFGEQARTLAGISNKLVDQGFPRCSIYTYFSQNRWYYHIPDPTDKECFNIVKKFDLVLVGSSSYLSSDGTFLRAANAQKIPTIAVHERNSNYNLSLGNNLDNLPTILAVVSYNYQDRMRKELTPEMASVVIARTKVVGWTAFDDYAKIKESFTEAKRENFLHELGLNSDELWHLHLTQNIHPDSDYLKFSARPRQQKEEIFEYETKVTTAVFEAASNLGLKLIVKSHPGEAFKTNYTAELADCYGFKYLHADDCSTQDLMLAVNSVTAGRSSCLNEAALLDRRTGGIFPDLDDEELFPFPCVSDKAIPYTRRWDEIYSVLSTITSSSNAVQEFLALKRKSFYVDGKASQRLADLVEELSS